MSMSPPISMPRLSSGISANKEQEELINAYEAEEERITNVLSRKLEQLRVEKIELENVLEAESENHVNRLSRELAILRATQQQQANSDSNGNVNGHTHHTPPRNDPTAEVMLDALRRENERLRNRLADIERDYIRMSRLNEIYREELIDHRNRIGQPVDNLIGMSSLESHSQPTHYRSSSNMSSSSVSSQSSMHSSSAHTASRPPNGVPIPRPPSQIRRPNNNISEGNTPLSHSPTSASSSESPYAISSPVLISGDPASLMSNLTTPPSSASLHNLMQYNGVYGTLGVGPRTLSYPSVPPPSLSSSFGSPTVSYHMSHREPSLSPVEPLSRRNSNAGLTGTRRGDYRVAESGNLRSISASRSQSRRESLERGARVAETGSLARSRAGSHSQGQSHALPSTSEDVDDVNFADEGTVFS
ncbi:hypothetical protein J3R30DRAFT_3309942 [Lentinula aciculospora]|uniref:Uncharacterized protein n=1 Tax=Lentinula aciculospora TaxID=153920 RepID=A0A9W9DET2_9AGAR|nr:hypothetical protein J3R30DRAFT_3309942 [Lentinula aciculospora]